VSPLTTFHFFLRANFLNRASKEAAHDLVKGLDTYATRTGLRGLVYLAPFLEKLCSYNLLTGSVVMPQYREESEHSKT